MIKNIVFDFGKVLVDYDYLTFAKKIVSNPEDVEAITSIISNELFVLRCDKGDESFEELTRELQRLYPQWTDDFQRFYDDQLDVITNEVPGMRELIHRLRAEGFGIYGLTNWSNVVYKVIEKFDILQLMDGTLISSEEKLIKPDIKIYQRFCEKFNLNPHECVFTDDKIQNVEGAMKAGIISIHFKNAKQYEEELREILKQQNGLC